MPWEVGLSSSSPSGELIQFSSDDHGFSYKGE